VLTLRLESRVPGIDDEALGTMLASLRAELLATATPRPPAIALERALDVALDGRVDAALVSYLPPIDRLARFAPGGSTPELRARIRALVCADGRPRWIERLECDLGTSAMLVIPRFPDELVAADGALLDLVATAIQGARRLGARRVSLAGMLPSATGYCASLVALLAPDAPVLTTGHTATVVAVVETLAHATERAQVLIEEQTLACVGLGSIGVAALELTLCSLPHPRAIVLCDLAGTRDRLQLLARRLKDEFGFRGEVRVAAGRDPNEAIEGARLVVAATSSPAIIDVDRMAPGTILVDDSFPACFDEHRAIARMEAHGDVLLVGGGLLAAGATTRVLSIPGVEPALVERLAAGHAHDGIAGCQIEPLLLARDRSLTATVGLVDPIAARRFQTSIRALGVRAARLHCGALAIDDEMVASFRRHR
jgi:predicted amino acid dehydrogenase